MNARFRVLLVTKSTGGVAEYVRWLAQGLDRSKYALSVACLSEKSAEFAAELEREEGLDTYSFSMDRYRIAPLSDFRLMLRLRRLLKTHAFDLVHAHASKPGFLVRIASIGLKVPVLYSPHGFAFHAGASRLRTALASLLERLAAQLTTRIIVVADGERELARQYRVGRQSLFRTVHTGIDPAAYREPVDVDAQKRALDIPADAPLVGTVGRVCPQKAPGDFIRTAAAIHTLRPDVHFVWIGDGPLLDEMRNLASNLGLDDVFHWAGYRRNVPQLLHALDCFLLTSRWEGFPLVILEALAAEIPVVATDILGTREAIASGLNGWLAPVGDVDGMAKAVIDLLKNPYRATAFLSAGRARIDNEFNRRKMLRALDAAYTEVLPQKQLNILEEITYTVQRYLPQWFDDKTKLVGFLPQARKYPHSFILRYQLLQDGREAEAILVKIPSKPAIKTIADAVAAQRLYAPTQETYRSMRKVWDVFEKEASPTCIAIQPLGYLERWNGIVMLEAEGELLKKKLLRWKKDRKELAKALASSARWLRIYHQRVGALRLEQFPHDAARAKIDDVLAALSRHSREQVDVSALRNKLLEALTKIGRPHIPVARLHDDFQYSNILAQDNGRVCALDADGRRRAPIYVDLATLIIDPETRLAQALTFGLFARREFLDDMREKILRAYFDQEDINDAILNFYCALSALHKWSVDEKEIMSKGFIGFPLLVLVRFWMKNILKVYLP